MASSGGRPHLLSRLAHDGTAVRDDEGPVSVDCIRAPKSVGQTRRNKVANKLRPGLMFLLVSSGVEHRRRAVVADLRLGLVSCPVSPIQSEIALR